MELADLRAFVAIADHQGISAAARALKQPKSSISRGLARLEQSVGAALVDRSSQHLRLTDAGILMRARASRILDEADDLRVALDGLAERPRGRLRINAPYTFAVGLIAPMLAGFAKQYPDIRVVLDIDNKRVNLHAEDCDLAVRVGAMADSDLVAQTLAHVELWTCASPGYLEAHGIPRHPRDLAGHRLVSRVDAVSTWHFDEAGGAPVVVDVRPDLVVSEPVAMLTLVSDGAGIARLPDFLARDALASGGIVRLLADFAPERLEVHAVYTSRRALSIKARLFIAALLAHLATPEAGVLAGR